MQRCFDLARLGAGKASPNPQVGAVVVFDGKIIGEGYFAADGDAGDSSAESGTTWRAHFAP